jgi:hypothetical protein
MRHAPPCKWRHFTAEVIVCAVQMIAVEACVVDDREAAHAVSLFEMDQKDADMVPLTDFLANLVT